MYTTQHWVFLLLPLTGISAIGFDITKWLNQFQFHVDPVFQGLFPTTTRQGQNCRDCTRSTARLSPALARFGFGTIVTPAPPNLLPCCPTTTAATPDSDTTTETTPSNCKCGVEGASRIVGGTVTTVTNVFK